MFSSFSPAGALVEGYTLLSVNIVDVVPDRVPYSVDRAIRELHAALQASGHFDSVHRSRLFVPEIFQLVIVFGYVEVFPVYLVDQTYSDQAEPVM